MGASNSGGRGRATRAQDPAPGLRRGVLAAGVLGELFPIVAISLFLTKRGEFVAIASIFAVAILLTTLPWIIGAARLRAIIRQG